MYNCIQGAIGGSDPSTHYNFRYHGQMFNAYIVNVTDKVLFDGEADSVMFPGVEGEFEVMDNHGPIAALLAPGVITVLADTKKKIYLTYMIEQGVMKFDGKELYVIVE